LLPHGKSRKTLKGKRCAVKHTVQTSL